MRKRLLASLLLACLTLVICPATGFAAEPAAADSDAVFGLTRVWKIHLHVTAENWKAMQPKGGGFPNFGPPGGPPGPPPANAPRQPGAPPQPPNGPGPAGPPAGFRPGSFGYEFEYVKADIELDGETFKDIGLRFKGNGTYMMSASGKKRPFKVDFNRYVENQRFHGMQQLNLHNNVMDPTAVRQALSYPVFQTAGVPSPRTAFAEVSLTIDGECDHERIGLYTLVEEIDKAFLKRHFQTNKGMLLKPEGTQGLEYKGEDWSQYAWYEPKSKPKKDEAKRLIDALRLIHKSEDDQFRQEIGSFLDIDEFARFLAANTLLANMDSFLTHVHNYYLYLPPDSRKFIVLPWDMDLSMGAFFLAGSAEQLQELSISHPHMGDNKLLDRLLAWDEFNKTYRGHLKELTETCFGENGQTVKSAALVQAAIKDQVAADQKQTQTNRGLGGFGPGFGPPGTPTPFGNSASLETFLAKRRESVLAQLAGTSKGRAPGMAFGPGPGGPRPGGPGGFGPGNFHGGQILRAADLDQDKKVTRQEFLDLGAKWLREWDKDQDRSLSTSEITAGMNEALAPPANSPFKPPEGFGPGNFMAAPLQKASDTDADGTTTREEWLTLFGTWFKQWDTSNDKTLDESELIAGLNKVFAPPPGFGPPGAPPAPTRAPESK